MSARDDETLRDERATSASEPRAPSRSRPCEEVTPAIRLGILGKRSFAELLSAHLQQRVTGTLLLTEPEGGAHAVHLVVGVPAKACLAAPTGRLGEILVRTTLVSPAAVDAAATTARRSGLLLGEMLIGSRLVERAAVERALRVQVVTRVALLANLPPETAYAMRVGQDLLTAAGGGEPWLGRPLDALLGVVRTARDRRAVRETALRAGPAPLELLDPSCIGVRSSEEAAVLATIARDRPTLSALLIAGVAPEETVFNIVCTLVLGRRLARL